MAGLLSGLKDLGLENLENSNIFEEKKSKTKQVERPTKKEAEIPKEEELVYDKSLECPVCGNQFVTKVIKTGRAKLLSNDMDLRPVYEGIDVAKYDVIQCEHCGYAALPRYFPHLLPSQRKLIQENISKKVILKPHEGEIYTYEEAMQRFKLCLVNAVVKRAKNSERAFICLKSAWLIRGYRDFLENQENVDIEKMEELRNQENDYLQNAYTGFLDARKTESMPMCGMDENSLDYLLAALAFQVKDYGEAGRFASLLLASSANKRIKEKALLIKEELQAVQK